MSPGDLHAEGRTCWWTPGKDASPPAGVWTGPAGEACGASSRASAVSCAVSITADLVDKFCPAECASGPGGGTLVGPGTHVRPWLPEKSLVASLTSTPSLTDRTSRLCQARIKDLDITGPSWPDAQSRMGSPCLLCSMCARMCVCACMCAHACIRMFSGRTDHGS